MKKIYEDMQDFNRNYKSSNFYDDSFIKKEGLYITNGITIGVNTTGFLKLENDDNVSLSAPKFDINTGEFNITYPNGVYIKSNLANTTIGSTQSDDNVTIQTFGPQKSITSNGFDIITNKSIIANKLNIGETLVTISKGIIGEDYLDNGQHKTYIIKLSNDVNDNKISYIRFFREIFNISLSDAKEICNSLCSVSIGEQILVDYMLNTSILYNYPTEDCDWFGNIKFSSYGDNNVIYYIDSEIVNENRLIEAISGVTNYFSDELATTNDRIDDFELTISNSQVITDLLRRVEELETKLNGTITD